MADTKVSALTAATSFLDADEVPKNEAGTSKKFTGTLLKAWAGNGLRNVSTATQAPAAATSTYLTNSNIAVPTGKLRIGTVFRWVMDCTKTAAGTAIRTFFVRIGTLGTTGDAAVITFTGTIVPTAAVDQGTFEIVVTIRGPLSASCVARGVLNLRHNLAATGFANQATEQIGVTSGTFDATTANLIVGLSVTTGTAEVITFQQIVAEALNL